MSFLLSFLWDIFATIGLIVFVSIIWAAVLSTIEIKGWTKF